MLWFYLADPQLSAAATAAIIDPANQSWVSPASYWEVAIKVRLGKYLLAEPFEDFWRNAIDANAFQILHLVPRHAAVVATLPFPGNHKDPFDRMIVAQAIVEGMSVVSADPQLDGYGISRIW